MSNTDVEKYYKFCYLACWFGMHQLVHLAQKKEFKMESQHTQSSLKQVIYRS